MFLQLLMVLVIELLNGSFFDGAVHAFDLTVCPGVVGLSRTMLDAKFMASFGKNMLTFFAFVMGELETIVG